MVLWHSGVCSRQVRVACCGLFVPHIQALCIKHPIPMKPGKSRFQVDDVLQQWAANASATGDKVWQTRPVLNVKPVGVGVGVGVVPGSTPRLLTKETSILLDSLTQSQSQSQSQSPLESPGSFYAPSLGRTKSGPTLGAEGKPAAIVGFVSGGDDDGGGGDGPWVPRLKAGSLGTPSTSSLGWDMTQATVSISPASKDGTGIGAGAGAGARTSTATFASKLGVGVVSTSTGSTEALLESSLGTPPVLATPVSRMTSKQSVSGFVVGTAMNKLLDTTTHGGDESTPGLGDGKQALDPTADSFSAWVLSRASSQGTLDHSNSGSRPGFDHKALLRGLGASDAWESDGYGYEPRLGFGVEGGLSVVNSPRPAFGFGKGKGSTGAGLGVDLSVDVDGDVDADAYGNAHTKAGVGVGVDALHTQEACEWKRGLRLLWTRGGSDCTLRELKFVSGLLACGALGGPDSGVVAKALGTLCTACPEYMDPVAWVCVQYGRGCKFPELMPSGVVPWALDVCRVCDTVVTPGGPSHTCVETWAHPAVLEEAVAGALAELKTRFVEAGVPGAMAKAAPVARSKSTQDVAADGNKGADKTSGANKALKHSTHGNKSGPGLVSKSKTNTNTKVETPGKMFGGAAAAVAAAAAKPTSQPASKPVKVDAKKRLATAQATRAEHNKKAAVGCKPLFGATQR